MVPKNVCLHVAVLTEEPGNIGGEKRVVPLNWRSLNSSVSLSLGSLSVLFRSLRPRNGSGSAIGFRASVGFVAFVVKSPVLVRWSERVVIAIDVFSPFPSKSFLERFSGSICQQGGHAGLHRVQTMGNHQKGTNYPGILDRSRCFAVVLNPS